MWNRLLISGFVALAYISGGERGAIECMSWWAKRVRTGLLRPLPHKDGDSVHQGDGVSTTNGAE